MRRRLVERGRVAQRAFDQMVHQRDGDIGQQQAGDGLVDGAVVAQRSRRRRSRCRRRPCRRCPSATMPTKDGAPATRDGHRRGGDAAEHERALAADDDEAEPRRQRDAERREQQRRGALQRVLDREPASRSRRATSARRAATGDLPSSAMKTLNSAMPTISAASGMTKASARRAIHSSAGREGRAVDQCRCGRAACRVGHDARPVASDVQAVEPTTPSTR